MLSSEEKLCSKKHAQGRCLLWKLWPQEDTSLAPLLRLSSLGRCWHHPMPPPSHAPKGLSPRAWSRLSEQRFGGALGAPGSSALETEHGSFLLTPTHVLAAGLFVISKRNPPVGVSTTEANLEGDPASKGYQREASTAIPPCPACHSLAASRTMSESHHAFHWPRAAERKHCYGNGTSELTGGGLCRLLGGWGRGAAFHFRRLLFELCWECAVKGTEPQPVSQALLGQGTHTGHWQCPAQGTLPT